MALVEVDTTGILGQVHIDLKQDSTPAIFNDRFLVGFGRCWSIRHGIDDIGKLAGPKDKRRPTIVAPDCQAYRDIFAEIRRLHSA